jgi:hypothetical protein
MQQPTIPVKLKAKSWLRISWLLPFLAFLSFFILGISIFCDYGISIDEHVDNLTGLVNTKYILSKIAPDFLAAHPGLAVVRDLHNYQDKHYGPFFQVPAAVIPALLYPNDIRQAFFARHLVNFVFCFFGLIAFYRLLLLRFKNWIPALAGVTMLVLSPRIFADFFYNGKDLPFLATVLIAWFSLCRYNQSFSWKWLAFHCFACAMAISTRFMGIILPALTYLWLAHNLFYSREKTIRKKLLGQVLVFTVIFCSLTILFWPYLWENPWDNFRSVFPKLNRVSAEGINFYLGEFVQIIRLPWHYALIWIFITTPVVYSVWFFAGISWFLKELFTKKIKLLHTRSGQADLTALLLFALPVLGVVATRAQLYDGWRHLYFVYPPFLYLAVLGLHSAFSWLKTQKNLHFRKRLTWAALLVSLLSVMNVARQMVEMHPYQHVYFSFLPAAVAEKNFDLDYWGLSYRQGLEYILAHDHRSEVKVAVNFYSGGNAADILKPKDRKRLHYAPIAEADYFLTEYRTHPQPYPYPHKMHDIRANGVRILSIFRLR